VAKLVTYGAPPRTGKKIRAYHGPKTLILLGQHGRDFIGVVSAMIELLRLVVDPPAGIRARGRQ
jgi:hypothetical protein